MGGCSTCMYVCTYYDVRELHFIVPVLDYDLSPKMLIDWLPILKVLLYKLSPIIIKLSTIH